MAPSTRKTGGERRREIAAAALRIIGERGVTAFTTSSLAAEIGVSSGALFRHFGSLDEVMLETVRQAVATIDATFPEDTLAPKERLLTLARNRVGALRSSPGIVWLLRSEQAQLTIPEEAVKLLHGAAARTRKFLLEAIREGVADGSVRNDIKPETLLVFITGTVHSLLGMRSVHATAKRQTDQDLDEILDALAKMIMPAGPNN